jgi:hypothetical protein
MAGKKKDKGGLDDQHIKNISMNFDYYRRNPKAKEDYWRNIAKAKHPEADALFDGLVKKSEEEKAATATAAAAAKAEPKPQNEPKKPEPIAQPAKPVETSSSVPTGPPTSVVAKPVPPPVGTKTATTGTSTSTKPITGVGASHSASGPTAESQKSPATETEGRPPKDGTDKGEELVNNESTLVDMPSAHEPHWRQSNGTVHQFKQNKVEGLSSRVNPSTALYPIRDSLQQPTTQVFTNRFEVNIDPKAVFHEFHIFGIPEGRSRRMTKMFVDTAIERSPVLGNKKEWFATDNLKKIIAWKDLREDFMDEGKYDKQVDGWHLVDIQDGDDPMLVRLYLQHIRVVDTKGLERYVASEPAGPGWDPMQWQEEATMEALNIVIGKCFGGNIVRTAANKFFLEGGWKRIANSPLCTIRGYYYSARPGMGSILLNVNYCTSAFFWPYKLSDLMHNSSDLGPDYPSVLTGLRVYIEYARGRSDKAKSSSINDFHSRIKRILELGDACNRQTFKFTKRNGDGSILSQNDITISVYLQQEYNITLRFPNLPAVNMGSRARPCWFPPEELSIMPYQIYSRVIPTALTAAMLDVACRPPGETSGRIEGEGMSRLLLNQNPKPADVS